MPHRKLRVGKTKHKETQNLTVNHSEISSVKKPERKLLSFLDLPPEIRNHIYDLVLPDKRTIRFYPQIFNQKAPKDVFLLIYEWPSYCGRPGDIKICRKLFQLNQQIRAEVGSIFYGRKGSDGRHHFHFTARYHHWPEFEAVVKLGTADQHAALLLQQAGIPFATLKTKTWASLVGWYKYDLLVLDWSSGGARWRKLKDISPDGPEAEDEVVLEIRREAERRSCQPLRLEERHFDDDYRYSNYPG